VGINLFGSRTFWWWRSSLHERKESWSLPDVTHTFILLTKSLWGAYQEFSGFL